MEQVKAIVNTANQLLRARIGSYFPDGRLQLEQYARYLSVQYHLTKGVQRHFLIAASHPALAHKRPLREFLFQFALEEEPHYKIAEKDLAELGGGVLPTPLNVKLWWAYFDTVIYERPFVRLGATCVLENFGSGIGDLVKPILQATPFITPKTSRFLQIHMHEELPHGDQILAALTQARPNAAEQQDLAEGAEAGATLFLRMLDWAFGKDEWASAFFTAAQKSSSSFQPANHLFVTAPDDKEKPH